jgi:predicted nucleic acid-binding protein
MVDTCLTPTLSLPYREFRQTSYLWVVTRIEILCGIDNTIPIPHPVTDLLNRFQEQPFTEQIINPCIDRRRNQRIKLPDAIIAATALHLQIPLVTRHTNDFKNIENLSLINPCELSA